MLTLLLDTLRRLVSESTKTNLFAGWPIRMTLSPSVETAVNAIRQARSESRLNAWKLKMDQRPKCDAPPGSVSIAIHKTSRRENEIRENSGRLSLRVRGLCDT
jgi:hypothetical protein